MLLALLFRRSDSLPARGSAASSLLFLPSSFACFRAHGGDYLLGWRVILIPWAAGRRRARWHAQLSPRRRRRRSLPPWKQDYMHGLMCRHGDRGAAVTGFTLVTRQRTRGTRKICECVVIAWLSYFLVCSFSWLDFRLMDWNLRGSMDLPRISCNTAWVLFSLADELHRLCALRALKSVRLVFWLCSWTIFD